MKQVKYVSDIHSEAFEVAERDSLWKTFQGLLDAKAGLYSSPSKSVPSSAYVDHASNVDVRDDIAEKSRYSFAIGGGVGDETREGPDGEEQWLRLVRPCLLIRRINESVPSHVVDIIASGEYRDPLHMLACTTWFDSVFRDDLKELSYLKR